MSNIRAFNEKMTEVSEALSEGGATAALRIRIGETWNINVKQVISFNLIESCFDKVPYFFMTINCSDDIRDNININDNDIIEIYYRTESSDNNKVMKFRLSYYTMEPYFNQNGNMMDIFGILDIPTAFIAKSSSHQNMKTSTVMKYLAGSIDPKIVTKTNTDTDDEMTWIRSNQNAIQFMGHLESRSKVSDSEDTMLAYFTRNKTLCYKSLRIAGADMVKWKFFHTLNSNDLSIISETVPENVTVSSIKQLNLSSIFNTRSSYGITVQEYSDTNAKIDTDTRNTALSIVNTTNINKNKKFSKSVMNNIYAGHSSVNAYTGMSKRQALNDYYKMNYFSSFIEVTIELRNQNSKFREIMLEPLDKVTLEVLNNPHNYSNKYSGEYLVITAVYQVTNKNSTTIRATLGRNGDNTKTESVDPGSQNQITPKN